MQVYSPGKVILGAYVAPGSVFHTSPVGDAHLCLERKTLHLIGE